MERHLLKMAFVWILPLLIKFVGEGAGAGPSMPLAMVSSKGAKVVMVLGLRAIVIEKGCQ